jgi:hypothetical protein
MDLFIRHVPWRSVYLRRKLHPRNVCTASGAQSSNISIAGQECRRYFPVSSVGYCNDPTLLYLHVGSSETFPVRSIYGARGSTSSCEVYSETEATYKVEAVNLQTVDRGSHARKLGVAMAPLLQRQWLLSRSHVLDSFFRAVHECFASLTADNCCW